VGQPEDLTLLESLMRLSRRSVGLFDTSDPRLPREEIYSLEAAPTIFPKLPQQALHRRTELDTCRAVRLASPATNHVPIPRAVAGQLGAARHVPPVLVATATTWTASC